MRADSTSSGINWPSIMALLSVEVIVYTLITDILIIFASHFLTLNSLLG
jgi:hypothetical protein